MKGLSQKGFSLIEILVALGLMGLSAMVVAGLFSQQMRMQSLLFKKMDLADLRRVATEIMANPQSCLCNFQGVNINPNAPFRDLNQIRAQFVDDGTGINCNTGEVLAAPNTNLVERISMENFTPLGSNRLSYDLVFYPQNLQGQVSLQPIRIQNISIELSGSSVTACGPATGGETPFEDLRICAECFREDANPCDAHHFSCSAAFTEWSDMVTTGGDSWSRQCRYSVAQVGDVIAVDCGNDPYIVE